MLGSSNLGQFGQMATTVSPVPCLPHVEMVVANALRKFVSTPDFADYDVTKGVQSNKLEAQSELIFAFWKVSAALELIFAEVVVSPPWVFALSQRFLSPYTVHSGPSGPMFQPAQTE